MIVFELVGTEKHEAYETLAVENLDRQYKFVESIVNTCLKLNRSMLTGDIIKALNYHAIACLHVSAGQWRPCPVYRRQQDDTLHEYPEFYRVPTLIDAFVNEVNRNWDSADPVVLSAFVLWKLNYIHPFINGNGRTARVACLLVLCLKLGAWIGSDHLLPELIKANKDEYEAALRAADHALVQGEMNLGPLHAMLVRLLDVAALPNGDATSMA